ncbi:MAG TPA: DUF2914 domain-containing protein, partial [Puia sp.]|nr:DUF2914 domain-containing protein [Puia sp.]
MIISGFKKAMARGRNWYARYERPFSSLSLIGGFIFDAVTLRRVDMFWENFWVVAHLFIVGACIILVDRQDLEIGAEANPEKTHFWLVNVMQFFFGGILSTYLVFYFRSGALSTSWPFLLLLVLAFWANESFKREYVRLSFQIVLFYLSLFAFTIYLVPVLVHAIGPWIFVVSGLASLVLMAGFLALLNYFTHYKFSKSKKVIILSIGLTFLAVNGLYALNIIPPIPLSLKDAGVYHAIEKDPQGDYVVYSEKRGWFSFLDLFEDFHASSTDNVYVYSAIFSPPLLDIKIVHHYEYYDAKNERWIDEGKITLPVLGGRESGFRTYSMRSGLMDGKWRVNVETENGQVIG